MGGRGPLAVAALAGVALAAGPAFVGRADEPSDAAAMLDRAYHAASTTAYTGVQYVNAWGDNGVTSLVVRITHEPHDGSYVQVASTVDAPETRVFEPDAAPPLSRSGIAVPGLAPEPLLLLRQHYDLRIAPDEPTAGRAAHVVQAWRRDGTLAASFWLDAATGLVLRRELYDSRGRLVRASAYVTIDLHAPRSPETASVQVPLANGVPLDAAAQEQLRRSHWQVPATLAGELTLYDVRSWLSGAQRVVHLSYSDGLSTLSLFEQRGRLARHQLSDWNERAVGDTTVYIRGTLPERLVWSAHGVVYTLVADAPEDVVHAALADLPKGHDEDDGFVARIERGLKRIGSWLNPFD